MVLCCVLILQRCTHFDLRVCSHPHPFSFVKASHEKDRSCIKCFCPSPLPHQCFIEHVAATGTPDCRSPRGMWRVLLFFSFFVGHEMNLRNPERTWEALEYLPHRRLNMFTSAFFKHPFSFLFLFLFSSRSKKLKMLGSYVPAFIVRPVLSRR